MNDNVFFDCEKNIAIKDIDEIECELGIKLPEDFKSHYLKYNGGTPTHTFTPTTDEWESDQVTAFIPIKYCAAEDDSVDVTLLGVFKRMRDKDVIPKKLLPFARDLGGNFFCLNMLDCSVSFFATDAFDPDLSMNDNHKKVERKIANSFGEFVNTLEDEPLDD